MSKFLLFFSVLTFAAGIYLGKVYYAKVETKTVEVVKDKIVTVTKVVKKPDGTIEENSTVTENKESKATETKTEQKQVAPELLVGVGYTIDKDYTAQVAKRLFGNVYLGVSGSSNGTIGIGLVITF